MNAIQVLLPYPVAVIPSQRAFEQLAADGITDPVTLVAEIAGLMAAGSLPARVDPERGSLSVYTRRHVATLYPSAHGDAYRLGHVSRLTFKEQERLLRGALTLVGGAGWWVYQHVRDVPPHWSSQWDLIWPAWAATQQTPVTPPPPASPHAAYLDLLTEVVQATRDIEIERQRTAPPAFYARRGSTREERHSARGVYSFTLVRPAQLTPRARICLADQPGLSGQIVRVEGREVVVRFDAAVDYRRIPAQGGLQVLPSDRVYRAQLDAIDTLRKGSAAGPYLLGALVDRQLHPYQASVDAQPRERLDPDQLTAFRRALTVPDQLLVLGPPGTGKTRTITEIAASCVHAGERVLVTSHTNRAVDNVLERIPPDIRVVRVGNEGAMTSKARTFMVETQVQALRAEILAATDGVASRLSAFMGAQPVADRWLRFLKDNLGTARAADDQVRAATAALDGARQRATAPVAASLAAADMTLAQTRIDVAAAVRDLTTLRQGYERAHARSHGGPFAFFFRWLAGRRERRLHAAEPRWERARRAAGEAETAYHDLRMQADVLAGQDPEVRRATATRDAAAAHRNQALLETARAAAAIGDCLRPLPAAPDVPPPDNSDDVTAWEHHRDHLDRSVATAKRRAELLTQWRDRIGDAGEELHRELVRYADVVAATCIGTATTALLAELDFDLAIVDEAGQISTPNLLVPLVRARRSVLVGDHRQLPPFLDDEVKGWLENLRRSSDVAPAKVDEVADLLRRSAFERLYLGADPGHRVMLTIQRRMPEALASFVSARFYSGALTTEHGGSPPDPVFHAPFAMADTADQPAGTRNERPGRRREEWNQGGYLNPYEATLITTLIARYVHCYRDWAVIVPYRAQAELIATELGKALGDPSVADNVGTVDSFQGGERDLIVYGFTRSNRTGDVGFLKELRRLNVAITRARQQLVLVGDSATLRDARDPAFADLFRAMLDHLQTHGDRRASAEVGARLAALS